MTRPLLLGLHNPLSARPDRALWHEPPGCSGHRLWKMSGLDLPIWLAAYNRMNLLDATVWDEVEAERNLPRVVDAMVAAPVTLVLGHQVRRFLGLPEVPWILPQKHPTGVWRLLPHPSGRTQTYNDPTFRAAVRLLLQELTEI